MATDPRERWLDLATEAVRNGTLVRLSLATPINGESGLRRVRVRPVVLRSGSRIQWVSEFSTREITKNLESEEFVVRLRESLGTPFRSAHLVTTTHTAELDFRRSPRLRIMATPAAAAGGAHDRSKSRTVDLRRPWLQALGVTTSEGRVCRGMEAKFRQIHRFVELLKPLVESSGVAAAPTDSAQMEPLVLVDMGCGKGYLTFAAHEHLQVIAGRPVHTLGVEARPELVAESNRIALETGCVGLEFKAGTIAKTELPRLDILVALHACDTATDDALASGIAGGASLLVVAPCCHREVRRQLVPPPALSDSLRHGILRERHAEIVTDALRAVLVEAAGYESRVFEFISPEHTAKNLMLAAVKRTRPEDREAALRRALDLARFYGIREQRLAQRLGIDLQEV